METPSPILLDVSVRDGSNLINHNWKTEQVAAIAKGLSEAGIEWAEISHGHGIGSKMLGMPGLVLDEDMLTAARQVAPSLKLSVFIAVSDVMNAMLASFVDFFDMGRIGIGIDEVPHCEKTIKKLKRFKKQVSVQLVRCHAKPPEFSATQAKMVEDMGADIVYVVDTFGSFTPTEVTQYVEAIRKKVNIEVGFHGHNMTGMAIPNTWAAWQAGARWLDASLLGIGRGAGNTNLEVLTALLQEAGQLPQVSLEKLSLANLQSVTPIFGSPPQSSILYFLLAMERLDYPYPEVLEIIANYLGMPVETLLFQLHAKMGDRSQVTDDHLRAVSQDYGKDFDQMLNLLKVNIP